MDPALKDPVLAAKKLEYERRKARAKEARARLTCTICGAKSKLPCPCGTTQYCSVACQKVDWRDRGHRKACKKIRAERAAEAARAEAPTPPPSPPEEVVYGPAPRSHADEVRARIAAEHEAARVRREANPERKPESARYGSRCPICLDEWNVNENTFFLACCCRTICESCMSKIVDDDVCALCHAPEYRSDADELVLIRRHVENEVPEAITHLACSYRNGEYGLVKSTKKATKIYKRAVELGNVEAMLNLGCMYMNGDFKLDKKKAVQLWRMAADRGQAAAQKNLALAYWKGDGCSQDLDEARRWLTLAAAQGLNEAKEMLAQLET
jgi:hypothetical protein